MGQLKYANFSSDSKYILASAYGKHKIYDDQGNLFLDLGEADVNTTGITFVVPNVPNISYVNYGVHITSPDGKLLAVSELGDTTIKTSGGIVITTLKNIEAVEYSPDSHYLIGKQFVSKQGTYDSYKIIIFDIENNFTPEFVTEYSKLYGINYDESGKRFITFGCTDGIYWEDGFFCFGGSATEWDNAGNRITDFKGLAEVTASDFVPGGDLRLTAGCDGIVEYYRDIPFFNCISQSLRLHDASGKTIAILRDDIESVSISPNGKLMVTLSGQYGGEAKLWRLSP